MPAQARPVTERAEVIALVASAGGLGALTAVLEVLPKDLPAAVLVGQHLGNRRSHLVDILSRRVGLPVAWARDGEFLTPGTVTVCPPQATLTVLSDRTCAVRTVGPTTAQHPLDVLLTSVADSVGASGVGVVLSGMGTDAAAGSAAVHAAGGTVFVQSEESAEHAGMPRAAITTGAADHVLALEAIGPALVAAVHGHELPHS